MSRPNILLVTVDSLRADYIFGSAAETPSIDTLAQDSALGTTGIAQGPFTTFSMPSLFTSKYPIQLTGIDYVEGIEGVVIGGTPTVQERLKEAGYKTAGIHSNPLLSETFGFNKGFDHFFDSVGGLSDQLTERLTLLVTKLNRLVRRTAYISADELTARAIRWLENNDTEPFFLWVHYMDVHGPYQPKSGFTYLEKFRAEWLWRKAVNSPQAITAEERKRLKEAYVEEIEYTDAAIGKLLEAFKSESGVERVVVLTADHGDEFYEHASYSHENKLYEELIRVPLFIDAPDGNYPDSRPVPLLDVTPTLVDIGEGNLSGFEGTSLLERRKTSSTTPIISEAQLPPEYIGSIRTTDWKYIHTPEEPELYGLIDDSGETENLIDEESKVGETFAEQLAAHRERCQGNQSEAEMLESSELNERLRSLGYLD